MDDLQNRYHAGMTSPDPDLEALQNADDRAAVLGEIFERHRGRLLRLVRLRMDPSMRRRVNEGDVLQETWIDIAERVDAYLEDPKMPFYLWMRFLAMQKVLRLRRHHVGTKKRDARREVQRAPGMSPAATSVVLVNHLLGKGTSPTQATARAEVQHRLTAALDAMNPQDREALVLRHFEGLTNAETAQVLGIDTSAASKRYLRALERIRAILDATGWSPSTK